MTNENSIMLIQHPVIQHSLKETGANVTDRIAALNLDMQVATEETVKTLKVFRAELNGEAKEFEEQRKTIKAAVLAPYEEFDSLYRSEIAEKYKLADTILKNKISAFEMTIKTEKRNKLNGWFDELCASKKIDWLKFDRILPDVNLSTSEKKYREQIEKDVTQVENDLALIATERNEAEILVEYRKSLSASEAIRLVRSRKEAERLEAERLHTQRTLKRTSQITGLHFVYHDLTRTYNWIRDESVMVRYDDIERMTDDEWTKKFVETEIAVNRRREELEAGKPEVLQAPTVEETVPVFDSWDRGGRRQQPSVSMPESASAPVEPETPAEPEEIFTARFEVNGTYGKLMKLAEFLKSNNYEYQNID